MQSHFSLQEYRCSMNTLSVLAAIRSAKPEQIVCICTNCGAVQYRQVRFAEMEMALKCKECGSENSITKEDI